jgi:hypothetical protein
MVSFIKGTQIIDPAEPLTWVNSTARFCLKPALLSDTIRALDQVQNLAGYPASRK